MDPVSAWEYYVDVDWGCSVEDIYHLYRHLDNRCSNDIWNATNSLYI
jgi:hypothetical protein